MRKQFVLITATILSFSLLSATSISYASPKGQTSSELKTGFAKRSITPKSFDTWVDTNGNAKKDKDEPFNDLNGNGKFDPIYLAGFQQNRPAAGVHNDIYAIATVIEKDSKKIAFLTLDTIGFMIDEVDDLRAMVKEKLGIDNLVVHSTHNHETPDTQGLWGPSINKSGINQKHLKYVKNRALKAITEANAKLSPSEIYFGEIHGEDHKFGVVDTRVPEILEKGIKSVIFVDSATKTVKGTWIHFANHVETVWNKNLLITSDWPGYVREGIEKGINHGTKTLSKGIGGITTVFIGNIGGLATTLPDTPVYDVRTSTFQTGTSFEKVKAQGYTIADSVLSAWKSGKFNEATTDNIVYKQKRFDLRVKNNLFILANRLGVIDRNMRGVGRVWTTTEVNHIKVGPIEILTIPGELYPEIALGGVVNLPGSDYDVEPEETPPLYDLMNGKLNLIINLANDSVGYLIPYTEWDDKKPYLNHGDSTYGEGNSIGDTAGRHIYTEAKDLILSN